MSPRIAILDLFFQGEKFFYVPAQAVCCLKVAFNGASLSLVQRSLRHNIREWVFSKRFALDCVVASSHVLRQKCKEEAMSFLSRAMHVVWILQVSET